MSSQYTTPIPQELYTQVGLISAIVGFFILAYFFMYKCLDVVTKVHSNHKTDHSQSK